MEHTFKTYINFFFWRNTYIKLMEQVLILFIHGIEITQNCIGPHMLFGGYTWVFLSSSPLIFYIYINKLYLSLSNPNQLASNRQYANESSLILFLNFIDFAWWISHHLLHFLHLQQLHRNLSLIVQHNINHSFPSNEWGNLAWEYHHHSKGNHPPTKI